MYNAQEKYEYMVDTYHAPLYRLLYGYCRNKQDAEDCVQTAYLKLWQCKKQFLSEVHAKNWLYQVAVNCARDLYRQKWSKTELLTEDISYIPEDIPFATEDAVVLFEGLAALREEYRMVILLYYYEEYSVKEIGKIMDVKENTVTTWLARAREQLRSGLEEEYGA